MKKKVLTMLVVAMTLLLAGCGKDKDAQSSSENINPDDYVKLGELEGLEVTVEVSGQITDEQIEQQISSELNYYVEYGNLYEYEEIPDKTIVEEGDMVNIDYEGKKDGVAFDRGTAEGAYLEIGSGSFIEGFESGLIGHSVGEEVDLNLTFPEDYTSTEMAGKEVVFHVKINSIHDAEKKFTPEFNDQFIQKLNFGFSSMEEYRDDVKSYMEQQNAIQDESAISDAIWQAVYDACEVSDPPREMVDEVKDRVYKNAENYAAQAGVELSEFISTNMNMTEEEFETEAENISVESAKNKLIMRAIAKQQGIEISKKQITETAEEEYVQYSYESADAYIQAVGGEAVYKDYLLSEKVDEYLKSVITVHQVEKQQETSESTVSENSAGGEEESSEAVSENTAE
ncbi:MAG: trigger factor [Lachnospiraceae bacterium]|nr:trigger factor [Lachnospiraceae bacterium]